jgi:hypothetical protein
MVTGGLALLSLAQLGLILVVGTLVSFAEAAVAQPWLGPEMAIDTLARGEEHRADVARGPDGAFVVIWQREKGAGYEAVWRRYDARSEALGAVIPVNTDASGSQDLPAVAMDDAGRFVIVWTRSDADHLYAYVYERYYGTERDA